MFTRAIPMPNPDGFFYTLGVVAMILILILIVAIYIMNNSD